MCSPRAHVAVCDVGSARCAQVMAASVEPALATRYLEVTGMVTPEVLQDDTEYGEVGGLHTPVGGRVQSAAWRACRRACMLLHGGAAAGDAVTVMGSVLPRQVVCG